MLTITEQILFAIKNSNKMPIDVNTLVKEPIEHKAFYIKNIKEKIPYRGKKESGKSD